MHPAPPPGRARTHAPWAVPALLALGLGLLGSGRTALWQDELATLSAADRSLTDLVLLAAHRDGVLAPYYALTHVWTAVAGDGPVALRLPSAVAVAAAAALTALLGARVAGRRAGLHAGLVLALLPAAARYGQEARPYALTVALAALATLLLLRALERPAPRRVLAYGASVLVLGAFQLTAVLLLAGHAVGVLAHHRRYGGAALVRLAAAAGAAGVALLPLAYVGARQRDVIGGLRPPTWQDVADLPGGLAGASAVGGLVLGLAALGALRHGVAGWTCLAVGLLPPALLMLLSLATPLWRDRYVLFTLPAWAVLAGAALARAGRREAALGLAALALLGLPAQIGLRGPTRPGQPDYPALATAMAGRVLPGDAVVVPTDRGARFRVGMLAYLPPGTWPEDVLVVEGAVERGDLDARECEPATCFPDPLPPRVWAGCRHDCADPLAALRPETAQALRRSYDLERTWTARGGALSLLVLRRGAG